MSTFWSMVAARLRPVAGDAGRVAEIPATHGCTSGSGGRCSGYLSPVGFVGSPSSLAGVDTGFELKPDLNSSTRSAPG
jgi:hypothetical protein